MVSLISCSNKKLLTVQCCPAQVLQCVGMGGRISLNRILQDFGDWLISHPYPCAGMLNNIYTFERLRNNMKMQIGVWPKQVQTWSRGTVIREEQGEWDSTYGESVGSVTCTLMNEYVQNISLKTGTFAWLKSPWNQNWLSFNVILQYLL